MQIFAHLVVGRCVYIGFNLYIFVCIFIKMKWLILLSLVVRSWASNYLAGETCSVDSDCMDGDCRTRCCRSDLNDPNCLTCGSDGWCAACKSGFSWVSGSGCTDCAVGKVEISGTCTDCPVGKTQVDFKYEIKNSGTCDVYITSKEECEEAAAIISFADTSAHEAVQNGPVGCFIYNSAQLKFDGTASTSSCSNLYSCICKTRKYFLLTSGTCDHYIMSSAECDEAAEQLGLSDTTSTESSWTSYAPGCFQNSDNNIIVNTNSASTADCGAFSSSCICKRPDYEVCETCQVGRYQNLVRSNTACKHCPSGKHQDERGMTSCKQCVSGKFSKWYQLRDCEDCGLGRFSRMSPCPPSHPRLHGPVYGNQYWCMEPAPSITTCRMSNSGIPPPQGGAWGANQPDCVVTNPCPGTHPYLRKYGETFYYCYSTLSGSAGACKLSSFTIPAPSDGQWGSNDAIDCTWYDHTNVKSYTIVVLGFTWTRLEVLSASNVLQEVSLRKSHPLVPTVFGMNIAMKLGLIHVSRVRVVSTPLQVPMHSARLRRKQNLCLMVNVMMQN